MKYCLLLLAFFTASTSYAQWQRDIGIYGGAVSSFNADGSKIYASVYRDIYRTSDKGLTWESIGNTLPNHPYVSGTAVLGSKLYAATAIGLFVTSDDGKTWSSILSFDQKQVWILDRSLDRLLVASWDGTEHLLFLISIDGTTEPVPVPAKSDPASAVLWNSAIFIGTYAGPLVSDDLGQTWDTYPNNQQSFNRFVHSGDSIFATTASHDALYLSIAGAEWKKLDGTDGTSEVAISADGSVYIVRDTRLLVFDRTKHSWKDLGRPADGARALFAFGDYVFISAGTDGPYRFEQSKLEWQKTNHGMTVVTPSAIFAVPSSSDVDPVLVSTYSDLVDFRSWWSGDGSESWQTVTSTNYLIGFGYSDNRLYSNGRTGLSVSSDQGLTWEQQSSFWPLKDVTVTPENFVSATQQGIAISTDFGATWKIDSYPLDVTKLYYDTASMRTFAMGKSGLYVSSNNGAFWQEGSLRGFAANSLLRFNSKLWLATDTGLFVSENSGEAWSKVMLPAEAKVLSLLSADGLYAGTSRGLFYSSNGTDWQDVSGDLPPSAIVVALEASGGTLYAGLDRMGLWKKPLPARGVALQNASSEIQLFQLGSKIEIAASTSADLTIVDLLGRTLIIRQLNGEVTLSRSDLGELPEGTYFLQVRSAGSVLRRPILIQRGGGLMLSAE